jgi:hypothetical protein
VGDGDGSLEASCDDGRCEPDTTADVEPDAVAEVPIEDAHAEEDGE